MTEQDTVFPQLPNGWIWTTINNLAFLVTKGSTPTTYGFSYLDDGINFIKVENLSKGLVDKKSISQFISEDAHKFLKRSQLLDKDLLFSIAGTIGKVSIVRKEDLPANTNQAISLIRCPWQLVDCLYLNYCLQSPDVRSFLLKRPRGVGMNNVSLGDVSDIPVSLPPLPEQHRIVTKIEELFTRLDEGIAELKKVKLQLKRYRQSLLKSAFNGTLTADWRQEHKAELEPASVLLERIKIERKKSGKYTELPPSDTTDLPELPEGWAWTTYNQIGQWFGGGTPSKENSLYWENGTIPWVSPKDMKDIKITQTEDKITSLALNNSPVHVVTSGSLLFVVRSGIIRRTLPIALNLVDVTVNQDLKALVPSPQIFPDYLLYLTLSLSEAIRKDCSKGGTTVESIEFPLLKNYIIPLPSIKEQKYIVEKIQVCLSVSDEIEIVIEGSIKQAERLRQSILKRAFDGKLVPQDPEDEPADKLLERIKAEKMNIKSRGLT